MKLLQGMTLTACACWLAGCASIRLATIDPGESLSLFCFNTENCREMTPVYRGTRVQANNLLMRRTLRGEEGAGLGPVVPLVLWPVALVDLPLCLVADTLTLPFAVLAQDPDSAPAP